MHGRWNSWLPSVSFHLVALSSALADPIVAAEVSPAKASYASDGSLEYSYDLRPLRATGIPAALESEFGEEAVAAFLASLPRQVTVRIGPSQKGLFLKNRDPERASLVGSFAAVRGAGPSIPDLDMLAWKASQFENGVQATLELAAEQGSLGLPLSRREFWNRVLEFAVSRYLISTGNEKEGALLLAKRVAASNCLDKSSLPARLKSRSELVVELNAEVAHFNGLEKSLNVPGRYQSNRQMHCIYLRDWILADPLPATRAGLAAALLFLDALDQNPKLARTYSGLEQLRDSISGVPRTRTLQQYRELLKGERPRSALEDLPDFVKRLSEQDVNWETEPGPSLFPSPETPISQFLATLEDFEQAHALEELSLALQDGRVTLSPGPSEPWELWWESALVPLLKLTDSATSRLTVSAAYRFRLLGLFHALHGAHRETGGGATLVEERETSAPQPPLLKVRLRAPPHLLLEPAPEVFQRFSRTCARLVEILSSFERAGSLQRVLPDGGRRAVTLRTEAKTLERLFHGLELISAQASGKRIETDADSIDAQDIAAAQRYLRNWRADPDLREDARFVQVNVLGKGESALHAGIFGIGRGMLEVSFSEPPLAELEDVPGDKASAFWIDTSAPQTYSVPVIVTGAVLTPSREMLDRARFRALCQKAGGDPVAIEAALLRALGGSYRASR